MKQWPVDAEKLIRPVRHALKQLYRLTRTDADHVEYDGYGTPSLAHILKPPG